MKCSVILLIISTVMFCHLSNGRMHCEDDKFPRMAPNKKDGSPNDKPEILSSIICDQLIINSGENEGMQKCINNHKKYFESVDVNTTDVNKYVQFCKKYDTSDSCINPENSIKLLKRLKYYCWTVGDIAETNKNIFNKDVEITPEDWKYLNKIEKIDLPLCFDQISSENIISIPSEEEDENPNFKFQNLELLKHYKNYLQKRKTFCNCVEVFGFDIIYDTFNYYNKEVKHYGKFMFFDEICINSEKKYVWKKDQLDAINEFSKNTEQVSKYQIDLRKLSNFFTVANILAGKRWFSSGPDSKWPVSYVLDITLIDINTRFGKPLVNHFFNRYKTEGSVLFDSTKVDVVAKAIFYGFSVDLFKQFLDVTSKIPIFFFGYPFNTWECRKLIIDAFFEYDREERLPNIRFENFHYSLGTVKYVNEHLNLFLKFNTPGGILCWQLSIQIKQFMDIFYTYWRKLDREHMSTLLTLAINNEKKLQNTINCLKLSSYVEQQIIKRNLLKYPAGIHGEKKEKLNYEDKFLNEFRERFFGKNEIYNLCDGKKTPNENTTTNVLELLYSEKERQELFVKPEK